MRNIFPKFMAAVSGLSLLLYIACCAAANNYDGPDFIDPFGAIENPFVPPAVFHLNKNYFTLKHPTLIKYDFEPSFMKLLNSSRQEQARHNQQKLFTLDRERSAYMYSIGAQDRPLNEQIDFLKQQLKKKQLEEAQNQESNK